MAKVDWRPLALEQGVVREPTPDARRIILWLRGKDQDGYQSWERVTNVPGAASSVLAVAAEDSRPNSLTSRGLVSDAVPGCSMGVLIGVE